MSEIFQLRRLQALMQEHIPLVPAMEAQVVGVDAEGLRLSAPLTPNANHHGTFFGGSAAALGILTGWGMAHLTAMEAGLDADVVIQRSAIRFLSPAPGAMEAVGVRPGGDAVDRAVAGYRRHGLSRLRITVRLECGGTEVGRLEAAFGLVSPETDVG